MSDTPIKVGLMGFGAVASYGHAPAIRDTEGLELCSVFDPSEDALARMQKNYEGVAAFTDVDAFFASDIDALTITSPAPCHLDNVLAAAEKKLPVLCEKPLAMNSDEASQMIAAMEGADVSLYTAFCYRFSPAALKIRELVRGGAVGDVRSLRLVYNWDLHGKYVTDKDGNKSIQKRREGRMLEGGPMVDCGTHQIDLAGFWLGSEVIDFSSHGAWVDEYEAPDHVWVHMDHANGAHTMVEMSYSYNHTSKNNRKEFVYELIGSEGVIRYDAQAKTFQVADVDGVQELEFADPKSFHGMYAEWARALKSGETELLPSAQDGMRVTDIARRATDAAIAGRKS